MWARQKGFTIVELLIVIVVIAILAAITIVAFNGVQQKARNSQTATTILAYKKALIEYAIDKQSYPTAAGACLGTNYPDTGVFTTANTRNCFRSSTSSRMVDAAFNTALAPYLGNKIPDVINTIYGDGSNPWATRGAMFGVNFGITIDGVSNPWVLVYTVEGQTPCPIGPVLSLATYPTLTSTPPASGYSQLLSGGTVGAECWLAMPDPAKM